MNDFYRQVREVVYLQKSEISKIEVGRDLNISGGNINTNTTNKADSHIVTKIVVGVIIGILVYAITSLF